MVGKMPFFFIFVILFAAGASSKSIQLSQADIVRIPQPQRHKLGSSYLQLELSKRLKQHHQNSLQSDRSADDSMTVVIYTSAQINESRRGQLRQSGCRLSGDNWTNPVGDHKYGFLVCRAPVNNILDIMHLDFIAKIDVAERSFKPQTNLAASVVQADSYWARGYDGGSNGVSVKIAILDAGLDETNPDLPSSYEKKDYSTWPTLDDDVTTFATGHGTHVTGIALGRGVMSAGNTGNSGGAYKGMAPGADLVFLKIGKDNDGTATGTAIYNALDAAVQVYHADVINLSYGSWDTYHDGSYYLDQKVDDIVYNYDVPVIIAAGNMGSAKRHYSETVAANSKSDFIQINVTGAQANSDLLKFNTVWFDGLSVHNEITLEYYDSSYNLLTDVRYFSQAESPRGTEHEVSYYNPYLPAGDNTYFIKIVNSSANDQLVHVYEDDENWHVSFQSADDRYTVSSPATADNAFAVGACGDKESWTDYAGSLHSSYTSETLCSFSGRGPRVDGAEKPQITAPGRDIIAIRDRNVYTTPSTAWVDDDGLNLGDSNAAHYLVRTGTSMAAPVVAGSAALILNEHPGYSADQVYSALTIYADTYQGIVPPDESWGFGVLDLNESDGGYTPIMVHLTSFTAETHEDSILLRWSTATDINVAGYNILRSCEDQNNFAQINDQFIAVAENSALHQHDYCFIDHPEHDGRYSYIVEQINLDGEKTSFGPVSTILQTLVEKRNLPFEFRLSANYPNPFNPATTWSFETARSGKVELAVYDLLGHKVKTLLRQQLAAGRYTTSWNGRNDFGEPMASGAYIIRMRAVNFTALSKATLLR